MLQLMTYAIDKEGCRISINDAIHRSKGGEYYCECCGKLLQATKGLKMKKKWHFKHVNGECTDKWTYEDSGSWHKAVQETLVNAFGGIPEKFISDQYGNSHRADVYIPSSKPTIIEIQHSPITSEDFTERNRFYKDECGCRVVWIFDRINAYETGLIVSSDEYDAGDDVYYKALRSGRIPSVDENISDILVLAQIKQCNKDEVGYDIEDDIFSRVIFSDCGRLVFADDDINSLSGLFQYVQNENMYPKKHFCDLQVKEHEKMETEEPPEKKVTEDERKLLDEARCEGTPDERLIELACGANDSMANALLLNKKVKPSRGDLFYTLTGILMQGLNYGTGEAIVKHLEEIPDEHLDIKELLCNQIYKWSEENEKLCVAKGFDGSYIRAHIAKNTTDPSILSVLLKNKSPGIRKTAVENPYADKEDVLPLYNDTDVHVRRAVLKKYADEAMQLEKVRIQREKQQYEYIRERQDQEIKKLKDQLEEQTKQASEFQKRLVESSKSVTKLENLLNKKIKEHESILTDYILRENRYKNTLTEKEREIERLKSTKQECPKEIQTLSEIVLERGASKPIYAFNIKDHSKYAMFLPNISKALETGTYVVQKENYNYGKANELKFLKDEKVVSNPDMKIWVCSNN